MGAHGTKVTLAKPPMFCTALQPPARARNRASTTLVTGAPCPPKAMSAVRKSAATVRPVRCAMTAASPIWRVDCGGLWKMVWPWLATRSIDPSSIPSCPTAVTTASPKTAPRAKLASQTSLRVTSCEKSLNSSARVSAAKGTVTEPLSSTPGGVCESSGEGVMVVTATSIPSPEVPLITPAMVSGSMATQTR